MDLSLGLSVIKNYVLFFILFLLMEWNSNKMSAVLNTTGRFNFIDFIAS